MFQPSISAGAAARPMPYVLCACAGTAHASAKAANSAMQNSRIGIGHLAISRNAPGPDRIVVVKGIFAANCDKFSQRRLHVTRFINGAALNDGRLAIPMPRKPEPGQRPRQHRFLELRLLPTLAVLD